MCKNITSITKIKSGVLYKCHECELFHLIYNNILLEFTEKEFESFKNYLELLETKYLEDTDNYTTFKKIPIPTLQQNLFLLFKKDEFEDLKKLVFGVKPDEYNLIKGHEINYQFLKN